jgi:putative transposase
MPQRGVPLVEGQIYHVIARGVDSMPIFFNNKDYQRFLKTFVYYQHAKFPLRFSYFNRLPKERRNTIVDSLKADKNFLVEILAFALMPNHYHFLVRQLLSGGVTNFCRLINNSYSKYLNTLHKRKGPVFENRFRAVLVESEPQLLHTSRYIHLNPFSSFVVQSREALVNYPYSSLGEYAGRINQGICNTEPILSQFKSGQDYLDFVFDNADYQRSLDIIKHQLDES